MESESLIFTGLEIPRDYLLYREVRSMKKILMRFIYWILMEEANGKYYMIWTILSRKNR